MAGTLEHTFHMSYSMNQARAKQRPIIITLLDLKNDFGEVHNNLITDVLSHHHLPQEIRELIKHPYTNFFYLCIKIRVHYGL